MHLAREFFFSGRMDLDDLHAYLELYRNTPEWMSLGHASFERGVISAQKVVEVKVVKRGNDRHRAWLKSRLSVLDEAPRGEFYDLRAGNALTSCLFVTLSERQRGESAFEAWESWYARYNRFRAALRKRYGELATFRVLQSTVQGWPHTHLIVLFKRARFQVFMHRGTPRIQEKDELAELWKDGHVDVFAPRTVAQVTQYCVRHLTKVHNPAGEDDVSIDPSSGVPLDLRRLQAERTLDLVTVHGKRSFSMSRNFIGALSGSWPSRLDTTKNNKNQCGSPSKHGGEFEGNASARNRSLDALPRMVPLNCRVHDLSFRSGVWCRKVRSEERVVVENPWRIVRSSELVWEPFSGEVWVPIGVVHDGVTDLDPSVWFNVLEVSRFQSQASEWNFALRLLERSHFPIVPPGERVEYLPRRRERVARGYVRAPDKETEAFWIREGYS